MFREAIPDLSVSIDDVIAAGDKVVTRVTWQGTQRGPLFGADPTGKRHRGEVHAEVFTGPPVYTLTTTVDQWSISDVVMASHGRTALAQFFVGGVAYELVHHLRCPVIVVPVTTATSS